MDTSSDVFITGLPRSGSTLVSALIDGLPDSVSLNAPTWQRNHVRQIRDPMMYAKWLAGDVLWHRAALLRGEGVFDLRAADGTHFMDGQLDPSQSRDEQGNTVAVPFNRPGLTPDFTFGIKHNALLTTLLPQLLEFDHFKIIAVIRNPVDVIASWQRMSDYPITQAKLTAVEHFWPQAQSIGDSTDDTIARMAQLYELFLERYHSLRERIHIVKYEDVLEDPKSVSLLFGHDMLPACATCIIDKPKVQPSQTVDDIQRAVRLYGAVTKHYYPD